MFCPKCGNECANDANFCMLCGAGLALVDVKPQGNPGPGVSAQSDEGTFDNSVEGLCRLFFDWGLFRSTVMGVDRWSSGLEPIFGWAAEADSSFARVDRAQFQREMTALRMELFLLALLCLHGDDSEVAARRFTKRYLEEIGQVDLYEIMSTFNHMLAETTVRDVNGQRPKGQKAEALFASTNKARMDWYYAWIDTHIGEQGKKNPPDMTPEEMELLDCAGQVANHVGVDIRRNDCIAVKMLSWRLAVHLGYNEGNLKPKALYRLQSVIFCFYALSEEYLKDPGKFQSAPGRFLLPEPFRVPGR